MYSAACFGMLLLILLVDIVISESMWLITPGIYFLKICQQCHFYLEGLVVYDANIPFVTASSPWRISLMVQYQWVSKWVLICGKHAAVNFYRQHNWITGWETQRHGYPYSDASFMDFTWKIMFLMILPLTHSFNSFFLYLLVSVVNLYIFLFPV